MSDERTSVPEVREGQRIAKAMARAGLCSRRDAEAWISAGRVTVNGRVLDSPAYNVSDADDVRVDGKRLAQRERTRLFLFHKPRGLVTTARDPEGRPTLFHALPPDLPRLVAVGRLDINTEGLILLTNDGGLARVLELPSTGWLRRYRVRAHGRVDQAMLDSLSDGVTVDGIAYAGIEARLDREQGSNAWITMGLREGKNREIKTVLEHLGLSVNRLIRISFGPFELGDLAEGEVAEAPTRVLRAQLGAKLTREAWADFDAPIFDRGSTGPNEEGGRRPPARREPQGHESQGRDAPERGRTGGPRNRGAEPARRGALEARPLRATRSGSQPERRRKHVSALRAEIAADSVGPRKRVERGATQDRKGRKIAVERISPAGEEARKRAAAITRGSRRAGGAAPGKRLSRRFEAKRKAEEWPRLPGSFEVKRARDGEGRERPARAEHAQRGPRAEFKPRGSREEPREPPPAMGGADRKDAGRTKRRGPASRRADPAGPVPPAGRRPPREAEARERRFDRRHDERRGAFDGGRSFAGARGRPPGKRPPKGPGGRPRRKP
ncbi:MAG TPA: pseudouridine synthase [Roseiarcus sp.]|jgi:23S rRNA pseudouridine2605 synthase|nr:pseudouridine synthase [Roseiarcus sp.]